MNIEIEYCVPCGHLDRAIAAQRELLETHGRDLGSVTLRTGHGGVFKIRVEGELVLDAQEDGFDLGVIHDQIEDGLAA